MVRSELRLAYVYLFPEYFNLGIQAPHMLNSIIKS